MYLCAVLKAIEEAKLRGKPDDAIQVTNSCCWRSCCTSCSWVSSSSAQLP
jgi:hypothetical protein